MGSSFFESSNLQEIYVPASVREIGSIKDNDENDIDVYIYSDQIDDIEDLCCDARLIYVMPEALAPVKCAVFPLDKKFGLPELAHEIVDELKFHFNTHYGDPKDSIGKRYRRQDAIGTPFCITVDHETPNDHKVTLRYRDTMEQERVAISDLRSIIEERVSITSVLKKLGNEIKNF